MAFQFSLYSSSCSLSCSGKAPRRIGPPESWPAARCAGAPSGRSSTAARAAAISACFCRAAATCRPGSARTRCCAQPGRCRRGRPADSASAWRVASLANPLVQQYLPDRRVGLRKELSRRAALDLGNDVGPEQIGSQAVFGALLFPNLPFLTTSLCVGAALPFDNRCR